MKYQRAKKIQKNEQNVYTKRRLNPKFPHHKFANKNK